MANGSSYVLEDVQTFWLPRVVPPKKDVGVYEDRDEGSRS